MANDSENLVLKTVEQYRLLAEDPANHDDMVKDKATLNFLAFVLDNDDEEILKASLTALELLCQNSQVVTVVKNTFGVVEALTALVTKQTAVNESLCGKAQTIIDLINTPAVVERNEDKCKGSKKKKILVMQVHGLHLETRKELEDILMKVVKGVLSVMVDVEHQRCTITVFEHVEPRVLATALAKHSLMEARLVTRNKYNQEMLISFKENDKTLDLEEDLPPYLDEKDSPVKDKAIRSTRDFRITASEWFSSAAGFLQKSFYW